MKESICYIVGAGENCGLDFTVENGDFLIAADGGLAYLEEMGLIADLVIGDFDSLPEIPARADVIVLNKEKDYTDTLAAVHEGLNRGYKIFHIYGGTGGRIDHTLANIQVLAFLSQNKNKGYLFDRNNAITAVTNGNISFSSRCAGYISVFSYTEKSTICIKGLKYELDNAVISNTFPIGVSNEFARSGGVVSVSEGTLIIVFPREFMGDVAIRPYA